MTKKYLHISLLCLATLFSTPVFATHIFGGELLYAWVPGNKYSLKLTLYGDCSALSSTFATLYTSKPLILVYRGNTLVDSVRLLPEAGTGVEVSPVCPLQLQNTTCNGGSLPGVKQFVYTADVNINTQDANWRFLFNGDLQGTSAGRSSSITNINSPSNTNLLTLQATLNNTDGPNSSPEYSTIPTPFYAVNLPQEYNEGAFDPNGDSLAFSLVPALNVYGSPVSYVAPASATAPLLTASGQFNFNDLSGQLSFEPNMVQDALVEVQVTEYRNGIIVGTSMREMTFVVLDNLGSLNNIGHTAPTNLSGGSLQNNTTITTCKYDLAFDIYPRDTAHNNITVTYTSLPPGAAISLTGNGTPSPLLHFSWNSSAYPAGNYVFYVTYKNDACPISTSQTIGYTIKIAEPYEFLSATQLGAGCDAAIPVRIEFKGHTPVQLIIKRQADTIWQLTCLSNTVDVNMPLGDFTGTLVSDDLICSNSFSFSVADSTALPCCRFSYPSAFTPNNDGRNDRFRVIATNPPTEFILAIYDRWGNKVFTTQDISKGWDGTYKGRPCDVGVYFYRASTRCLGRTEEKKGDITLIK